MYRDNATNEEIEYTIEELEVIAMTLDKLYEDSEKKFGDRDDCWLVLENIRALSEKTKMKLEIEIKRVEG